MQFDPVILRDSIKTRGYHVGLRFAPTATFDKAHRQSFQLKLSEGFDWRRQDFGEKAWVLLSPQAEGDPRSHTKLTLQPDTLNFEEFFPISPLDAFCDTLKLALEGTAAVFGPRVVLGSGAMIRLTTSVPGDDARVFLGNRCLHLDDRLAVIGRPVHAVGLRLVLPPTAEMVSGGAPWQAEVRIESLVEDVRQLFVEVDTKWLAPCPWSPETIVERLRAAHEFAVEKMLNFLEQFEPPVGG
ncbi:MAG: hypothetical protein U1A27_12520 [Phycisphaerae bacterium]